MKTFRVAVVQMKSSESKADNLKVAIEYIGRVAEMIMLTPSAFQNF